eukprot:5696941-Pyramimonas_sp.AAC.2
MRIRALTTKGDDAGTKGDDAEPKSVYIRHEETHLLRDDPRVDVSPDALPEEERDHAREGLSTKGVAGTERRRESTLRKREPSASTWSPLVSTSDRTRASSEYFCQSADNEQRVPVGGNGADTKGNHADTKGNGVDTKGDNVDTKGNGVDTKGDNVDTKGNDASRLDAPEGAAGVEADEVVAPVSGEHQHRGQLPPPRANETHPEHRLRTPHAQRHLRSEPITSEIRPPLIQ